MAATLNQAGLNVNIEYLRCDPFPLLSLWRFFAVPISKWVFSILAAVLIVVIIAYLGLK